MLSYSFMKSVLVFLIVSFLTSCSVGPKFHSPPILVPEKWKHSNSSDCSSSDSTESCSENIYLDYWWEVFQDGELNKLESLALENNRDLFVAYERVLEARALMIEAAAAFYPQLTLNPQYSNLAQLSELYGISSISTGTVTPNPFIREHQFLYFLPANLSYEVDLWGKIKDRYDSARYNYAASKQDYDAVMLTLTTNLATAYFQLRSADTQLNLLAATLKTRLKAFEINEDRYEGKISFYSDVTLSGEEVTVVIAQQEEVLRQRGLLEDQIAVLIGIPASEFKLIPMPLEEMPPCIPEGIPFEILTRRPDVLEALMNTKSQHELVREAYTEFFPSLTLTAAGGFESPVLKYFLQYISRYWMYGASSNQVLFDGGRLEANLQRQMAIFKEMSGTYQQTVLTAFQEVEDALNNIDLYAKQYQAMKTTVEWAEISFQLYTDRYNFGLTDYIDVVNTERALLNYQINLNQLLGYRYASTIQLIKALGGGWSE